MSFPLPHASVPVGVDSNGKPIYMTEPWLLYFAKEQVAGGSIDPVNASSAAAMSKAASAEMVALQAMGRQIQQFGGMPSVVAASRMPILPESFIPAFPLVRREWSIFSFIPITAAIFTSDFTAIPSAYQSAVVFETDTGILRYSDGAAWTLMGQLSSSVASGVYTPTLTNGANVAASTAYQCQYSRNGSVVTVSGVLQIDPTAPAAGTELGIELPIASNFGAVSDCGGVAFASAIAGQGAAIGADTANDRASLQYVSGDITNQFMYFIFQYRVI